MPEHVKTSLKGAPPEWNSGMPLIGTAIQPLFSLVVRLAREGWTRLGSPGIFGYSGEVFFISSPY